MTTLVLICLTVLLDAFSARCKIIPASNRSASCRQNFREVSCLHLKLTRFPTNLTSTIRKLDLSHNCLKNLTVQSKVPLHLLRHLKLSHNQLEYIDPTALEHYLTNLKVFILAANHLDRNASVNGRAFCFLQKLRTLDMSANGLDSSHVAIYLQKLPKLERLDLSLNRLNTLSSDLFLGTPHLRVLLLRNNVIQEIEEGTFESLLNLVELNLSGNWINCISDLKLIHLQVLNLSFNYVEIFHTEETDDEYQLEILDLSHNKLTHFPLLPKIHRIKYLNLSGNALKNLTLGYSDVTRQWGHSGMNENKSSSLLTGSRLADTGDNKAITNLSLAAIIDLDLSKNQVTHFPYHFFHHFVSVMHLKLGMNCLQVMDEVSGISRSGSRKVRMIPKSDHMVLPSLKSLFLQDNLINSLPPSFFQFLPALEELDLRNNNIKLCSVHNDLKQECLSLRHRTEKESCTSFAHVESLKHLKLTGNNLGTLPPLAFYKTPLVNLDLSGNPHMSVSEDALQGLELSLQELHLGGNLIDSSDFSFPSLKRLRTLNLSGNSLQVLPSALAFSPLEMLDIQNNSLQDINFHTTTAWSRTLKYILLSGNNFNCCALDWLKVLKDSKVNIPDLDSVQCFYYNETGTFAASADNDYSMECPYVPVRENPTSSIIFYVIIALILFILIFCAVRKCCKYLGLQMNRVASVPYKPEKESNINDLRLDSLVV
ncbi:transforming growth factor beta activator LRRC32-like isoform X2 [Protopterus annectens]|uniref:transforming growth factor beta activator LRRC32-like isoform X2 n=1 Tax=Protopterus annectens TaxID=7888 RepID=UPI001CFB85E9|nr:transforming growth factor beta activator LRRC32-like isoform X2 [Protopterus annectens]